MQEPIDRRTILGATDATQVLGLAPGSYGSPLQVWLRKRGEIPEQEETPIMRRGTELQPYIAAIYSREMNATLIEADRLHHPDHPWLVASPDYYDVANNRIVEIKSHSAFLAGKYGDSGSKDLPAYEQCQCLLQMHLYKLNHGETPECHLCVMFSLDDIRYYQVAYDEQLCLDFVDILSKWWQKHVVEGVPPEVTGAQADSDWFRTAYPNSESVVIEADGDTLALIESLRQARAEKAEIEDRVDRITNTIKMKMKTADELQWTENGKVQHITWRSPKSYAMLKADIPRMKIEIPEILAQYSVDQWVKPSRRFLVPRSWGAGE